MNEILVTMKMALKDWLKAVSGRVPIWTGMARGSLFAVAQLTGGRVLLSPLKGPSRINLGKSLGSASLTIEGNEVLFTFRSSVLHYAIQEDSNVGVSPSAPWKSLDAGAEAFEVSFKKLFKFPIEFTTKAVRF